MEISKNLKKLFFNLDISCPIQPIFNSHHHKNEFRSDMHYEVEIGIVLKGTMRRLYTDHEMVLHPGDFWFCGMWEPHGYKIIEAPCDVMVLVVDPNFIIQNQIFDFDLIKVFLVEPKFRPLGNFKQRDQILKIARLTKNRFSKTTDMNWVKVIFFELALTILENWRAPKVNVLSKTGIMNIQPALYLIFTERRLISTKEAAVACKMSESSFRTQFKKFMHFSFSDFALNYRIRGALRELEASSNTQEKIAAYWGFTDASHLQKCLKKVK